MLSKKQAEKRTKWVKEERLQRGPIPATVQHLQLSDGTRIKEKDYRRLRALFDTMTRMGYDLRAYTTVSEVRKEYREPAGHTPRRHDPAPVSPSDEAQERVDQMISGALAQARREGL